MRAMEAFVERLDVEAVARPASTSDADVVIRLENVSVRYRVPQEPIRSFKEYAIRRLQGRVTHRAKWSRIRRALTGKYRWSYRGAYARSEYFSEAA